MCDRWSIRCKAIGFRKKIYFEILQTVGRKIPDSTWALFKKQYQSLYPMEKGHNAFTIIICKYMVQMWSEWNSLREYIYHITRTLCVAQNHRFLFMKVQKTPKVRLKGVLILQLFSLLDIFTMLLGLFCYLDHSRWARISSNLMSFFFINLRPTAAIMIIIIIISEISKWSFIMRKQVYHRYKTLIEKMYWT